MRKTILTSVFILITSISFSQTFNFNTDGNNEDWKEKNDTAGVVAGGEYTLSLEAAASRKFVTITSTTSNVIPQDARYMHLVINNLSASIDSLNVRFALNTAGNTQLAKGNGAIASGSATYTYDLDTELGADWSDETVALSEIRMRFVEKDGNNLATETDLIKVDQIVFDNGATLNLNSLQKFNFSFHLTANTLYLNANSSIQKVEVYNILGEQVIKTNNLNNNNLDISSIRSGMYISKIFINDIEGTFKFLKQ